MFFLLRKYYFFLLWMLAVNVSSQDYPFRNISLPWNDRVDDLVGRLTLKEIVQQMSRGGSGLVGGPAPPIQRLGIGRYSWNTECLAGDVSAGNATSFPQPIGMAASFSRELIFRVAQATAVEVRGKHNDYVLKGMFGDHKGASCFSPVINIMRDPRWGRNQETYGEDPFLSGELAESFIQGLQGNDSRYIRASGGCKHFDVYGGPDNIPVSKLSFNANVSEIDWRTTFLPAFRRCVEAGTYSLMCSYNSINGVPACANSKLLTDILRNEWGFTGYVISDRGALESIINDHKYVPDPVTAAAMSVKAGVNLELSDNLLLPVMLNLEIAQYIGMIQESTIRDRVKSLFYTRMRLGEFDPSKGNPYSTLGLKDVLTPEHVALSQEAAVKSFVLLKNINDTLPLTSLFFSKIALVGPMADNPAQMYGHYSATMDRNRTSTPRDVLWRMGQTFGFAPGCTDNLCPSFDEKQIQSAVQGADYTFAALGTGQEIERSRHDRYNISLPGKQLDILKTAVQAANGKPVILLLFTAGPVNIQWAEQTSGVSVIMQLFMPAQTAGLALQQVLLNENGNSSPAGRLPYTWYAGDYTEMKMTDYSMVNRTYRYLSDGQQVLYPFGYGLSYGLTKDKGIVYSALTLPQSLTAGYDLSGSVTVENQGALNIDEVIQVYLSWDDLNIPHPNLQLVSFSRVSLTTGQSYTFKFTVPARDMAVYHNSAWTVFAGNINIYAGGQQPNQPKAIEYSNVVSQSVQIVNYAKLPN